MAAVPSVPDRGRSLLPRLSASVSGSRGHLGAHRTLPPRPTPQTGTAAGEGCGLAKVAGKARPRRPAPPPESSPAPRRRALERPAYHAGAAPHRSRAAVPSRGLEPSLQGAGSGRDCEPGRSGRAAGAGKTRAGAGAGLARDGRARRRSLACPKGRGKTRPDSPARGQPRAGPGPPDVGGGTGGNPRPPRANLSAARARGAARPGPHRGAARPWRPGPLPAALCAASRCAPARTGGSAAPTAAGTPAGRPARPLSLLRLLLASPAPLRVHSEAASEEKRSARRLPDPRRLLLGLI
nr:translation initiation factor IF-2-like [Equus asinus]